MEKKFGIYFDIFILIVMAATFLISLKMDYFDLKLLPLMVSGAGFILMGVGLINNLWTKRKADGVRGDETPEMSVGIYSRYFQEGLWIAGFFAAIYLVGFSLAMLFFITSYLRANKVKWATSIAAGILGTVVLFCVFNYLLEVHLYPGLILK